MPIPRLAALALLVLPLAACATTRAPITGRPPIPPGVPAEYLHFSDATVGVGDKAPDFRLRTASGDGEVQLSWYRGKPVVLVFGSHT